MLAEGGPAEVQVAVPAAAQRQVQPRRACPPWLMPAAMAEPAAPEAAKTKKHQAAEETGQRSTWRPWRRPPERHRQANASND